VVARNVLPVERQAGNLGVIVGSTLVAESLGFALTRRRHTVMGADGDEVDVSVFEPGEGVVVLPRHGVEPRVPAHRVDHHANLRALADAGCDRVLALCSVGSLRDDLPVGSVLIPDDVFAPNVQPTAHAGMEGHRVPRFDAVWRDRVVAAWAAVAKDAPPVTRGVYAQTTGPRFETPSEVRWLAHHADVVGMTMASELFLAGDLGLAYAGVCTVDNLANGLDEAPLTFDAFEIQAAQNAAAFAAAAREVVDRLSAS
jgi:5'-methylthioadenosine phosphorylase